MKRRQVCYKLKSLRSSTRWSCERASLLLLSWAVLFALLTGCKSASTSPSAPIDRRNPEAVLRAYFDAWARNDADGRESFMITEYAGMVREPVDSVRVLSITPVKESSETIRVYAVSFEIKGARPGSSVESGRHNWTYSLTWDAKRGSWLISNYGAG